MFNHVMIGSNDVERAKAFYDAVLATVGVGAPLRNVAGSGHVRYFYRHAGNSFCISQPINDEPATCANGATLGFKCDSPEQVRAFHDAAVAAGGTSIEHPPGERNSSLGNAYIAYVRDLDGHKLCALHRLA